jgi:hypothetical protein
MLTILPSAVVARGPIEWFGPPGELELDGGADFWAKSTGAAFASAAWRQGSVFISTQGRSRRMFCGKVTNLIDGAGVA